MMIYKSKLQVLSPEQPVLMHSWVLSCCVFLLYLLWFILQVKCSVIQMIFWLLILLCFSLWPFWKCLDHTWVGCQCNWNVICKHESFVKGVCQSSRYLETPTPFLSLLRTPAITSTFLSLGQKGSKGLLTLSRAC